MDTTQTTHLSLCSGYGGIDLGLRRAIPNLRTVAYAEIEAFACENLLARMEGGQLDPAPIWPDLKSFPWGAFSDRVDILSGGYPCQPFSAAGKRLGTDDPRHLWPYIADGIRILRPRICFFENVEGHISLGLSDVIEDLAGMGYRTTWGIFSASECGAPHQRKRVFILAYADGERGQGPECFLRDACEIGQGRENSAADSDIGDAWPSRPGEQQYGWEPPRVVADSHRIDRSGQAEGREHDRQVGTAGDAVMADSKLHGCHHTDERSDADGIQGSLGQKHEHWQAVRDGQLWPSRPGEQQYGWEPPRVVAPMANTASVRFGEREHTQNVDGSAEEEQQHEQGFASNSPVGCDPDAMLADSHRLDRSGQAEGCGESDGGEGEAGELGDTAEQRRKGSGRQDDPRWHVQRSSESDGSRANRSMESEQWQTQPAMGGDADGPAGGLDYAELSVSCDNRTDELRLIGNGVVPATATLAFQTLLAEFLTL